MRMFPVANTAKSFQSKHFSSQADCSSLGTEFYLCRMFFVFIVIIIFEFSLFALVLVCVREKDIQCVRATYVFVCTYVTQIVARAANANQNSKFVEIFQKEHTHRLLTAGRVPSAGRERGAQQRHLFHQYLCNLVCIYMFVNISVDVVCTYACEYKHKYVCICIS